MFPDNIEIAKSAGLSIRPSRIQDLKVAAKSPQLNNEFLNEYRVFKDSLGDEVDTVEGLMVRENLYDIAVKKYADTGLSLSSEEMSVIYLGGLGDAIKAGDGYEGTPPSFRIDENGRLRTGVKLIALAPLKGPMIKVLSNYTNRPIPKKTKLKRVVEIYMAEFLAIEFPALFDQKMLEALAKIREESNGELSLDFQGGSIEDDINVQKIFSSFTNFSVSGGLPEITEIDPKDHIDPESGKVTVPKLPKKPDVIFAGNTTSTSSFSNLVSSIKDFFKFIGNTFKYAALLFKNKEQRGEIIKSWQKDFTEVLDGVTESFEDVKKDVEDKVGKVKDPLEKAATDIGAGSITKALKEFYMEYKPYIIAFGLMVTVAVGLSIIGNIRKGAGK